LATGESGPPPRPIPTETRASWDPDPLFFDRRRHFEALLKEVSKNLADQRPERAFAFIDRRCRLLAPSGHDFLLRAEISRRAGFVTEGFRDLARALELDPTDRPILRAALSQGEPAQKTLAARLILSEDEPDRTLVRAAVDRLFEDGETFLFALSRRDGALSGWAAWNGADDLRLSLAGATERQFTLAPVPDHWLAAEGRCAATIQLDAADGDETATFLRDESPAATERIGAGRPVFADPALEPAALTIIVPVYEDFDATRACFEALWAGGAPESARLIAVDDASPNSDLRDWLDAQAAAGRLLLLRNASNLGFAVSVNRALALCPAGDVVLLNADAFPPPGSLARLAEIARAAPDIGTLTPFSNNGEYASFPTPNAVNPLPDAREIARIDTLAEKANGYDFVDLPNGIGFCLYITRACLDAVGPLPEIYARGYYEDVEFCLRAREKGFRNVCATGVYVGHAGSRSFRAEKRRLVMRNLAILERRFPQYHVHSASFVEADPLRRARGAIEALAPATAETVALVCAGGAAQELAWERAETLAASAGPTPLIVACLGARAELRGASGAWPQSLSFVFDSPAGLRDLITFLRSSNIVRIELFDPLSLAPKLLLALFRLAARVELAAGDLEWAIALRRPFDGACRAPDAPGPCPACTEGAYSSGAADDLRRRQLKRKRAILSRAQAILPLDRMADRFARHVFRELQVASLAEPPILPAPLAPPADGVLAAILPAPDAIADRLLIAIGRALREAGAERRIVVFGACVDDLALMASGNVFVAGGVKSDEYERLLRQYEVSALISPHRTRFFGQIDRLSRAFALPKAYFDFSFGKLAPQGSDLALDPRLCDAKAARVVAQWLETPRVASC